MSLTLRDNLPVTTVTVAYQGTTMDIPHVLVDTGSATARPNFWPAAKLQIGPSE